MERSAERFGKDDTRRQIRGRVDKALQGEPSEEELRERLRGAGWISTYDATKTAASWV